MMAGKLASSSSSAAKRALTEVEVGITEYLCRSFRGFEGVIKKRFKDFIVHEVDLHGRVVKLTKVQAAKDKPKVNANGKGLSLGHNTKPDKALVLQGLNALATAVNEDAAARVKTILVGAGLYEEPVQIVSPVSPENKMMNILPTKPVGVDIGSAVSKDLRVLTGETPAHAKSDVVMQDGADVKQHGVGNMENVRDGAKSEGSVSKEDDAKDSPTSESTKSTKDTKVDKENSTKDAESTKDLAFAAKSKSAKDDKDKKSTKDAESTKNAKSAESAKHAKDSAELKGLQGEANVEESSSMYILPAEADKAKRTALHGIIREHFGGKLVTDTVNLDPSKTGADRILAVRVVLQQKAAVAPRSFSNTRGSSDARSRYGHKRKRNEREEGEPMKEKRRRKDGKIEIDWRSAKRSKGNVERTRSERRARFLEFVLLKENTETHYVANKICRFLGDRHCKLSTAGTKDKRGVTTQKVVITNCKADQVLRAVAKGFQRGNVVVGNFNVAKSTLRLGDLQGNHFTLVLRDVTGLDGTGEDSNGDGSGDGDGDAKRDEVVVANAEGRLESLKHKGFINYFGMQRFGSRKVSTFMIGRQVINGNLQKACELILQLDANDKDVIVRAKEMFANGAELRDVIRAMPFYMTAENAILKGMEEHGRDNYALAFKQVPWSLRTLYTHSYQSFVWNHMVSLRMKMQTNTDPVPGDLALLPPDKEDKSGATTQGNGNGNPRRRSSKEAKVKVLTAEDISSGKWKMTDVVLPLPGYDVVYPTHAVNEEAYKAFIDKDGASSSFFAERKGDYRLPGSYRKVIAIPEDFEYEWISYEDDEVDLALTDLDVLNNVKLDVKPGSRRALKCSFKLPQSTYATMVLREMMLTTTGLDAIKT